MVEPLRGVAAVGAAITELFFIDSDGGSLTEYTTRTTLSARWIGELSPDPAAFPPTGVVTMASAQVIHTLITTRATGDDDAWAYIGSLSRG